MPASVHKLYELSFRSLEPLRDVTFWAHGIEFAEAIAPSDLASHLGRLARQLRKEQSCHVLAHVGKSMILCQRQLSSGDRFRITSVEFWNLAETEHDRYLKQLLNLHIAQCFREWGFRVDEYGHKAFLKRQHRISPSMEAQRFIKWNVRADDQGHVIFAVDYGNTFQDSQNLALRGLKGLYPDFSPTLSRAS